MKRKVDKIALMSMYSPNEDDYYDDENVLPKPEDPKVLKRKNRPVRFIAYFFAAILIGLIIYLINFQINEGQAFENSTFNRRRIDLLSEKYVRGSVYSSDGEVLSYTETVNNKDIRVYPFGNVFCHVIGYSDNGGSGIEGAYHSKLLSCHANIFYRAKAMISEERLYGDNLYTSLDSKLQTSCYNALGNNKGAVVVLDVKTGAVLSMVSKPDYDPNDIVNNWDYYTSEDENVESILLNRATQGLYPPGSTFKIFSALTYVRENEGNVTDYTYDCEGTITHDGNVIKCYHYNKHGKIDFRQSFAKSCNSSFVNIGINIERENLIEICESFRFNNSLNLAVPSNNSKFLLNEETDTYELMQTVIGQGKTLVTPMHMAMIAATIANDGKMMKPYFIDHVETFKGVTIYKTHKKSYGKLLTDDEVEIMQDVMKEVVLSGTAKSLNNQNYTAAGKTGSAEFGTKGDSHSWFVGYAPADEPEIAICVLVEGAGSGAEHAVPTTKKILDEYYN